MKVFVADVPLAAAVPVGSELLFVLVPASPCVFVTAALVLSLLALLVLLAASLKAWRVLCDPFLDSTLVLCADPAALVLVGCVAFLVLAAEVPLA